MRSLDPPLWSIVHLNSLSFSLSLGDALDALVGGEELTNALEEVSLNVVGDGLSSCHHISTHE